MGGRGLRPRAGATAWALVVAWTAVILTLSGDTFSAGSTSRFLGPLLHRLLPGASPETLEGIHFAVRKSAHLFEYGVLALLAHWAWRGSGVRAAAPALSLVWVLAVAVADETGQARSAARTGAWQDVVLDLGGGAAALALAAVRLAHRAEGDGAHG